MRKRNVIYYYIYGYIHSPYMDKEFPDFQFKCLSIGRVCDFVGSCNLDLIELEITRQFDDGTFSIIDVDKLLDLI